MYFGAVGGADRERDGVHTRALRRSRCRTSWKLADLCFARGHKGKGRASHKTLYAPAITGSSLCMYVALLLFLGNTGSPISRGAMMTVEIVLYNEKANVCCYYPLFPHHYKKNTPRSLVVNAPNCST